MRIEFRGKANLIARANAGEAAAIRSSVAVEKSASSSRLVCNAGFYATQDQYELQKSGP
jgi:hypothetical protein